jgi:hypothetical protein
MNQLQESFSLSPEQTGNSVDNTLVLGEGAK